MQDWLMWAIAGAVAVYLLAMFLFKNPFKETGAPADYEKGWRDFYDGR